MSAMKVIGVIFVLGLLVAVGLFIAAAVYFYLNPPVTPAYSPLPGGPCSTTTTSVPSDVSCYKQDDYNVYPLASPTSAGSVSFGPIPGQNGPGCYNLCNNTSGCLAAQCVSASNGLTCTCTGYSTVPTALASDADSDSCKNNNECSTMYIKS